ncbi:MAG TPA: hypothetical protein VNK44_05775 [Candidatus Nitrosotenuis sp.]|nr:hypothetical protein [Candidatus Nitrosotenuis sp.]
MNKPNKVTLSFVIATVISIPVLYVIWYDQAAIAQVGIVISVAALLVSLWYDQYKSAQNSERRKQSLLVYKRNLLFKLEGTLSIIHWTLESYLSHNVASLYPTTFKIRNMSVSDFRKNQFDNYKIYYDEIKYFSTSEIVPIEIKEELDFLNLQAEKLINFLPVTAGKLNEKIFHMYINKMIRILKWAINDEDSDLLFNYAKHIIEWLNMLLDLKKMESQ